MRRVALAIGLLAAGVVPLTIPAVLTREQRGGTSTYRGSRPPPGIHSPDFQLRSSRGGYVDVGELRGRVALITFLDTRCTTKCPIIAAVLGDAIRQLPDAVRARTTALAISVDPEHDTPERARRFLERRHALGALDFLLGTTRQLRPVWRAFYVLPAADTGDANVHSADVRVFDPRGVWVSTLHEGVDLTAANLAHDIETAACEC
jgi:cytochrome oxidase Cu insertion factor (SCO1/SenC/PrrC family)